MNTNPTNKFNPEIADYFRLNDFEQGSVQPPQGGYLFLRHRNKEYMSVQFWRDRIEVRRGFNFTLTNSYMGYDGQDIFTMMMLMHIMDVIKLEDVKRMAAAEKLLEGANLKMAV